MWSIITIVILFIIIILLVGILGYFNIEVLEKLNEDNTIYMFGGDPAETNPSNQISLKCPQGRKIKVLDAWYETYDPNYQFSGDSTLGMYGTDEDGNVVGPVDVNGIISDDLDSDIWGVTSNAKGLPKNNNYGVYNKVCVYDNIEGTGSTGSGDCRILNVLPTVAALANDKNSITVQVNDPSSLLPSPCVGTISNKDGNLNFHDLNGGNYNQLKTFLPIGSPTIKNVTDSDSIINGQQGYYLHGTYTCSLE